MKSTILELKGIEFKKVEGWADITTECTVRINQTYNKGNDMILLDLMHNNVCIGCFGLGGFFAGTETEGSIRTDQRNIAYRVTPVFTTANNKTSWFKVEMRVR